MGIRDYNSERLFVDAPLETGVRLVLSAAQTNYLINVLRLKPGDEVSIFNGQDGQWQARVVAASKRSCELEAVSCERPQESGPDVFYVFAPLKRARLDYMVQKAVEMGVARLCPVLTQRTIVQRVNVERMRANVIEAAEQCGILRIPQIDDPATLKTLLAIWPNDRRLVFCDEGADLENPAAVLSAIPDGPLGLLIGPEGGFAPNEREMLLKHPGTIRLSLGPRIMRADTAAVAALALVNTILGDWR